MEILKITLSSLLSLVVLFVIIKVIGNKSISQITMFDYVNGITIGSIAAELATEIEGDMYKPLTAMIIYGIVIFVVSYLDTKSISVRRFVSGKSIMLLSDKKLYKKSFKKARLDVDEFLVQCRNNGYFDITELECAIMEPNGKISFMPVSAKRPVTPDDMKMPVKEQRPAVNVIIDGNIMEQNLQLTGNDREWLIKQLNAKNISKISDVFLATCSYDNTLSVYRINDKNISNDMFQ